MAPEDGTRNTAAGGGQLLKKGPWTAAEDAMLMEYVSTHGEGSWNAVQRNSGLMRCGKSCRLRWANHLRPNLKKGAFTPEEERQIIELHSKFGNKWARMALHLPGRTDNEIKNYWNTRLKRRLRAGLPIYPIYPVDFQHHHQRQHKQSLPNQAIPLSSTSSLLNHANASINSISPLFNPLNYNEMNKPFYLQNSQSNFDIFHSNTRFTNRALPSSLQSNLGMIQIPKLEPSFDDVRLFQNVENELPSIQSSFQTITPTCSSNTANDNTIAQLNDGDNAISPYVCHRYNSGLLEDVLGESRALISSQVHLNECKSSETNKGKAKIVDDFPLIEEEKPENVIFKSVFEAQETNKTAFDESSSDHSSIEIVVNSGSDVFDEMIVMDDEFSSWLDFPDENRVDVSNSNVNHVEISCTPVETTEMDPDQDPDHDWSTGPWCHVAGITYMGLA